MTARTAFRRALISSVAVPIVVMAILAAAFIVQLRELMANAERVRHTDEVIGLLYRAQTSLVDGQSSVRGYILTGDPRDLAPFEASQKQLPEDLQLLGWMTRDRAAAGELCDQIGREYRRWADYVAGRIELRRSTGQIPPIVPDSVGRQAITAARNAFEAWVGQERHLRVEREATTDLWARWTIFGSGVLTIFVGCLLALLSRVQMGWLLETYERALREATELSRELERRVEVRTRALSDSNGKLNEVNGELEAFAHSISHDLRAPMRHITGFANLLRGSASRTLSAGDVEHLDTIHDTAVLAGRMVDDLLSFSRVGRTHLRSVAIDMNAVVADCLQSLVPDTFNRVVEWQIATLPPTFGDPALVKMAVQNLIANAVKYTGSRDRARIEVGGRAEEGGVTYWVRDNGVGFDMAYVHKLFNVFQRLHRAEDFEGTGIGLANVRRIIVRHGGRVWADGTPDAGATFYFHLPGREVGDVESSEEP